MLGTTPTALQLEQGFGTGGIGLRVELHCKNPKQSMSLWVIRDRGSELCRPPTSASPRKLTSGPNEKLVPMGQKEKWTLIPTVLHSGFGEHIIDNHRLPYALDGELAH